MNCQACGAELAPGAASCQRCGAAAGAAPAAGGPPPPPSHGYQPPGAGQPPQYGWVPPGPGLPTAAPVAFSPLGGLATATQILLGLMAAASLVSIAVSPVQALVLLLYLPLVPVFIVWFYRARQDAGGWGWRQRWAPGWAIGAWFVPVVFLFFPYMIMADIWRAGLPDDQRKRPAWLPAAWWVCWLLTWFTGFWLYSNQAGSFSNAGITLSPGSTLLSKVFEAAAAVLLILVVRAVSTTGVGRGPAPGLPDPAPAS
ncbi:MAG: DUF4328 domain-containing protein [Gemmatimonadota bacterium]